MSQVLRIQFGQNAGSGKDTACDYLISKYGGIKLSFASPIYDIMHYAQNIAGLPICKDRNFLRIVGTEWGRKCIDANIWVDVMKKKVAELPDENIFISDYRHPNESLDGFIKVRIINDRVDKIITSHESETQILYYDYTVENNDDIETFYETLDDLIAVITLATQL